MIEYNELAEAHYAWVEAMGWHNKTVLEAIALIASEVGEVAQECADDGSVTAKFGEELADIVLRTIDLAKWQKIDLDHLMPNRRLVQTHNTLTPEKGVLLLIVLVGKWVNTARGQKLPVEFADRLGDVLVVTEALAHNEGIDLSEAVRLKMDKNLKNGTRGRKI